MRPVKVIVLALTLLGVGCAGGVLPRPGDDRAEEVAELKRRVLELERQIRVNEIEIERLRRRLSGAGTSEPGTGERVERRLETPPADDSPPEAAPAPQDVEELATREPSSGVEEGEIESLPPVETGEEENAEASGGSAPPPRRGDEPIAPIEETRAVPREGQELYDAAYTAFHEGRYEDAEEGFRLFVETYADTELSDNAQYWIGSSRFARGDHDGAVEAFRDTVERYPNENKVPDALFKMGQALDELGRAGEAREVYEQIIARFPNTAAATLAEERLQ